MKGEGGGGGRVGGGGAGYFGRYCSIDYDGDSECSVTNTSNMDNGNRNNDNEFFLRKIYFLL